MGNYQIKDLESLTGIKAHTIRIWESRYGIVTPSRTDTNIRFYTDYDARRLMNIAILNKNGIKISRIKQMSDTEINQEAMRFAFSSMDYSLQIDALVGVMVDMDELKFEKILSNNILQTGFEETIIKIVFPFLSRIGLMWQTGSISPAQEHFVSNLIRQKIIVAIDSLPALNPLNSKRVILFLPEYEQHEISLLFTNYLFRSRAYHTIYLGQQTPAEEVVQLAKKYNPTLLFSVYTNFSNKEQLINYTNHLTHNCPDTLLYLTGYQALQHQQGWSPSVKLIHSFDDLYQLIDADKHASPTTKN